jgi:hypothetical protein
MSLLISTTSSKVQNANKLKESPASIPKSQYSLYPSEILHKPPKKSSKVHKRKGKGVLQHSINN